MDMKANCFIVLRSVRQARYTRLPITTQDQVQVRVQHVLCSGDMFEVVLTTLVLDYKCLQISI